MSLQPLHSYRNEELQESQIPVALRCGSCTGGVPQLT
jgi:hypothetical protein